MADAQNPFGLHTITPYLVVPDVRKLIAFLEEVFNATLRGEIHLRDDGTVEHAEVQIGDSVLMMGELREGMDVRTCGFYTYVSDCDAVYQTALDAGAMSVLEPVNYPHGDRCSGVRDDGGNHWWIVTHVGKQVT